MPETNNTQVQNNQEQAAQQPAQQTVNPQPNAPQQPVYQQTQIQTKFCKNCGQVIDAKAVICPKCGCQIEQIQSQQAAQPNIVINNSNMNSNVNTNVNGGRGGRPKNKWVALILCFFLGCFGAHKFYEGKAGMGVLYLFTMGLFCIGAIVDFIVLLFKPNPYYV